MNPQNLEKLADLMNRDLAGWQLVRCYYPEISFGFFGKITIITVEDEEDLVVLDKSLIQKVCDRQELRLDQGLVIISSIVVANLVKGIAFALSNFHKEETKPLRILTNEEVDALCQKKHPFRWTTLI